MIKNNKGYMLTETIIALTVVATVITFVYAIVMNNYIKQDNEMTKYNTINGLYIAKEVDKTFYGDIENLKSQVSNATGKYIDITNKDQTILNPLNIKKIYFSKYNVTSVRDDAGIPNNVKKQLKSESYDDRCNYRYLIIFNDDSYSTIGVNCRE